MSCEPTLGSPGDGRGLGPCQTPVAVWHFPIPAENGREEKAQERTGAPGND